MCLIVEDSSKDSRPAAYTFTRFLASLTPEKTKRGIRGNRTNTKKKASQYRFLLLHTSNQSSRPLTASTSSCGRNEQRVPILDHTSHDEASMPVSHISLNINADSRPLSVPKINTDAPDFHTTVSYFLLLTSFH
jgi:hypothetical protein